MENHSPRCLPGVRVTESGPVLHVVYQNVRGLNTKLKHFRQNCLTTDCDVIAATETYLTESVNDPEVVCEGWRLLRRDRPTRCGGGVLLACRPTVSIRRRVDLETSGGEDLWATLSSVHFTCHVCVVYIPPSASDDIYVNWFHKVESIIDSLNGAAIIVGDLNLNPKYTSQSLLNYYCYFLTVCGLTERNEVNHAYGGKLDVVLVSDRMRTPFVNEIPGGGLVPKRDAYHPPLDIVICPKGASAGCLLESVCPSNIDPQYDWNFSKGNYDLLYDLLSKTCWLEVFQTSDVNIAVEAFYSIIYELFDNTVPKKRRSKGSRRRYPVWFTKELIKDIELKARIHRDWKSSKDSSIYNKFSLLRGKVKERIAGAYDSYIYLIQEKLTNNPRAFWHHVSSLRSKGGFEPRVTYKGKEHVGSDTAAAFSDFFSSVFLSNCPDLDYGSVARNDSTSSSNLIQIDLVTQRDVEDGIKRLKPGGSPGPDNIPTYVLKGCREFLLPPICYIFNLSLSTGRYPDRWKITRVTPIPKTNDVSRAENYRPIAILSAPAKLYETVLNKLISVQLKPFLSDSQHGFRLGRSVDTNLLEVTTIISEHLDRGVQVDVLYFDFKKAFDRVDNDVLLAKLCGIGFSPRLLRLFADYLKDRQQYVKHGCFASAPYHTRSGVSQGSILGPLLFNVMVNDLNTVVGNAICLLYADDLKLIYGIRQHADCECLQGDLDSVFQWSVKNRLHFNPKKCFVMSFSRSHDPLHASYRLGDDIITRVNTMTDLGVVFDTRLTFHDHVKELSLSCYRRLGFIIRNARDFHNPRAIKLLYTALVRSKLEAASIVWNPYQSTYALLLEKVQKAFLRFLYKKCYGYYPFLYPSKFLLGSLGMNSLEVRRNFFLMISVCGLIRGRIDCPELVSRVLRLHVPTVPKNHLRQRARRLMAIPASRTVSHGSSPLVRALEWLNVLLASAPECDLFASGWMTIRRECLRYCEVMDDCCVLECLPTV